MWKSIFTRAEGQTVSPLERASGALVASMLILLYFASYDDSAEPEKVNPLDFIFSGLAIIVIGLTSGAAIKWRLPITICLTAPFMHVPDLWLGREDAYSGWSFAGTMAFAVLLALALPLADPPIRLQHWSQGSVERRGGILSSAIYYLLYLGLLITFCCASFMLSAFPLELIGARLGAKTVFSNEPASIQSDYWVVAFYFVCLSAIVAVFLRAAIARRARFINVIKISVGVVVWCGGIILAMLATTYFDIVDTPPSWGVFRHNADAFFKHPFNPSFHGELMVTASLICMMVLFLIPFILGLSILWDGARRRGRNSYIACVVILAVLISLCAVTGLIAGATLGKVVSGVAGRTTGALTGALLGIVAAVFLSWRLLVMSWPLGPVSETGAKGDRAVTTLPRHIADAVKDITTPRVL